MILNQVTDDLDDEDRVYGSQHLQSAVPPSLRHEPGEADQGPSI